jgi:hypothetical protein
MPTSAQSAIRRVAGLNSRGQQRRNDQGGPSRLQCVLRHLGLEDPRAGAVIENDLLTVDRGA